MLYYLLVLKTKKNNLFIIFYLYWEYSLQSKRFNNTNFNFLFIFEKDYKNLIKYIISIGVIFTYYPNCNFLSRSN